MARPVRLAYRSREAGEGGIDVRARVCPPRPRGRWVRRIRGRVIAGPVPPAPRSSAVVDPRIGDLGPALLVLEDGSIFPGVAFGAPIAAGRDRSPERDAREDRPILEREQRRTEVADPWIDDGARAGCRRHGSGDHAAPDTTNPPASRARWADACADIDASFAGLTGPVRQPHRTGHERTGSG